MEPVQLIVMVLVFAVTISIPFILMYIFDKRLKNRDKET